MRDEKIFRKDKNNKVSLFIRFIAIMKEVTVFLENLLSEQKYRRQNGKERNTDCSR